MHGFYIFNHIILQISTPFDDQHATAYHFPRLTIWSGHKHERLSHVLMFGSSMKIIWTPLTATGKHTGLAKIFKNKNL